MPADGLLDLAELERDFAAEIREHEILNLVLRSDNVSTASTTSGTGSRPDTVSKRSGSLGKEVSLISHWFPYPVISSISTSEAENFRETAGACWIPVTPHPPLLDPFMT